MAVHVSVRGGAEARRVAALCRVEARRLQLNVNNGVKAAARGFKPVLVAATPQYMPSGYAPLLAKSIRVQTVSRAAGASIKVSAKGKRELRDLTARNRGELRHPVFGRRKQKWVEQKVRAGMVDDPFRTWLTPRVRSELDSVLDGVRNRIERG